MGRCFVEGCRGAGVFGLRFPGLRSGLGAGVRGSYLWHCAAHGSEAEARRAAGMVKAGLRVGHDAVEAGKGGA
jgi:hypothetical protein